VYFLDLGASEAASLIFYLMVGYKFRPHPENPYLRVQEEDAPYPYDEAAEDLEGRAMGVRHSVLVDE
jgi:hypothetical protein